MLAALVVFPWYVGLFSTVTGANLMSGALILSRECEGSGRTVTCLSTYKSRSADQASHIRQGTRDTEPEGRPHEVCSGFYARTLDVLFKQQAKLLKVWYSVSLAPHSELSRN